MVKIKNIKITTIGHSYGFLVPKALIDCSVLSGDKRYLVNIEEMPIETSTANYTFEDIKKPKGILLIQPKELLLLDSNGNYLYVKKVISE